MNEEISTIHIGVDYFDRQYVMVCTEEAPEMYPEFAPGPPEGEEDFWGKS